MAQMEAYQKAYESYVEKLMKYLPINDVIFTDELSANNLLPGDTSIKLKALHTQAKKASYFLDHVIKSPLDIGVTDNFDNLLSVMEHCEHSNIVKLACEIKSEIYETSDSKSGMDVCTYMYVLACIV